MRLRTDVAKAYAPAILYFVNVEFELQDSAETRLAVAKATEVLKTGLAGDPVLSEFAGRMTSLPGSILGAIKVVQASDHEVLPVDLTTPWVPPNLYFLALMAAQKTRVRQLAFVDSRVVSDRFLCFSSPTEVLAALDSRYPGFREVARHAQFDQDPRSAEPSSGISFFSAFTSIHPFKPNEPEGRALPLTPETLLFTLGSAAHQHSVQWTDPPGEREFRAVLACESPYVATLKGTQLLSLVSRERVAVAVAKAATQQ